MDIVSTIRSRTGNSVVETYAMSLREELRSMPGVIRITVYLSLCCLFLLALQCLLIMPVILVKYGWDYGGAYAAHHSVTSDAQVDK